MPKERDDRPLADRVALVTGGGRGIGRACASALGRAGARILVSARTRSELEQTVAALEDAGSEADWMTGDLAEPETALAVVAAAEERFGRLDILVNNAGIAPTARAVDIELEDWERVLRLNLTAAFLTCREALPGMTERGWGRIVNVASTAGKVGFPYTTAYTASKHGLLGLTRALAAEVAGSGVTVNAVCPGFARTNLTEEAARLVAEKTGRDPDEVRDWYADQNPIGRLIEPEEVARAVLFLAEEGASGIHGQAINIDGGSLTI